MGDRSWGSWSGLVLLGLLTCSGCSNADAERGYDSCMDACGRAKQCASPALAGDCTTTCTSRRDSNDDIDCEAEWADYMDCLSQVGGCESTACTSSLLALSSCSTQYCTDHPSEPRCQVES